MFVQRLFAFFGNVWSFILTLVRSLLALLFFRRRSSDPLVLPRVNRTPKEALVRAHSRLRPILLTPRSISFSPAHYVHRTQSTRTRSATSTLIPGHDGNQTASGSIPQPSGPDRTSPKLDPHDSELGFPVTASTTASVREGTPNTSSQTTHTGSLSVPPLTPPDRCYLVPMPSVTDCPYAEPWPTNTGEPRLSGSPLKVSINTGPALSDSMVEPVCSPPPGHWNTVQIWTSTPCKEDDIVPDPALSPFDHHTQSSLEPSSALVNISHALISRSRGSIPLYDDASNSSASSDASMFVNHSNGRNNSGTLLQADPLRERYQMFTQAPRFRNPQFHHPDVYAWRRRGTRLPGKSDRATHVYTRSFSHMDLASDAYAPSPISALSPPLGDSATEEEDEDEVPLGRLKDRMLRRSGAVGATIGLGVPVSVCMTVMSPRTRRMSDGCLLAISESTPTRIGVSARSGRISLDGDGAKDWFEALSLRFTPEQKGASVVPTEVRDIDVV